MQYHYITLKEFKQSGFDVIVDKTWEDLALKDCFDETCHDLKEMQQNIDRCNLDWFMLRVRVMLDGYEMASHYLGGCLYEDAMEVFEDGIAQELIDQALEEAEDEVLHLRNKLDQLLVDIQHREPV
jgi:hypothetical protein